MMDSAFQHGDENMVRQLFEIYSEEFKLQQNNTMIQLMLNAKGKGLNLAKKKITAISDQRRSAIPELEPEIVEDISDMELQDRDLRNERNTKQCSRIVVEFEPPKNKEQYLSMVGNQLDQRKKKEPTEKKGFSLRNFFLKGSDPATAKEQKPAKGIDDRLLSGSNSDFARVD